LLACQAPKQSTLHSNALAIIMPLKKIALVDIYSFIGYPPGLLYTFFDVPGDGAKGMFKRVASILFIRLNAQSRTLG